MQVNKFIIIPAIAVVTACSAGNFRESVGLRKKMPDEFRVIANAPLSVPPEFILRPPVAGAKRPNSVEIDEQAKQALLESSVLPAAGGARVSKGESIFLQKAAAENADADIRNALLQDEIDAETEAKNNTMLEKVKQYASFGRDKQSDPVVNAGKEKERLTENKKDGKPVTEGETPVVEEKGGLLNKVFGN